MLRGKRGSIFFMFAFLNLFVCSGIFAYEIRVNCGGPEYTTKNGEKYLADQPYTKSSGWGYIGGDVAFTKDAVQSTEDDSIYQSERWGTSGYIFDLPDGIIYNVKLQFSEQYFNERGKRVFSIYLEGRKVISDLDIYAKAGHDKALDFEFPVKVSDGRLNITASAKVDQPKFSAIAITEAAKDSVPPEKPHLLSANASEKDIMVKWQDNAESDLQGYDIYRAAKKEGPYGKINSKIITSTKYIDRDVLVGATYYYIKAVDVFDNQSPESDRVFATVKKRNFFHIPDCAWERFIGDIPENCASSSPNRGIPLGGFGAGSFMYSISGAFGPWAMDIAEYHQMWLSEGAFHIYEKSENKDARAKVLSAFAGMKPAWEKLKIGEGKYYALSPKGWTTYNSFDSDISSVFFSPIIAQNYKETSYPVAVWEYRFHNPTPNKIEISLMFTWPQPPFGNQPRVGFKNILKQDGNNIGIVLKATDPSNTPETQNTEWCLATKKTKDVIVSYVTSWNKNGSGSDIWSDFTDDGVLSNKNLDNSNSAAALAIKIKLSPNETKIVPLVLSWDFPVTKFKNAVGDGTEWWKKYCQYFGRDSNNSFDIAKEALANYHIWEAKIDEWMQPVIDNPKYPTWLKRAAFNELYYTQFGGSFYESGLKSGHGGEEYKNLHPEDNKFFVMECMAYRWAGTFDVRHYNSIIYAKFWPQIEKETLMVVADAIMYFDPLHQTPHDFGSPTNDPFFSFDDYGTRKTHWKDLHSKFIQQVWRYYYLHKDKKFLDYVWPAVKATYGFTKTTDTDGDYLPNNEGSDNTYDSFGFYGTSLLCGGLWVGALEAMEQMAIVQNDLSMKKEVQTWLSNAKANLDKQLWDNAAGYYRLDTKGKHSMAIMSDGLNGQRYCESFGLADILPKEKMSSHFKEVFKRCVSPLADFTGDSIGDVGAINAVNPDGSYLGFQQSDEIWTGSTYFLAASMYRAGLKEEALKTAFGIYYITYEEESTAYWFNTPEAWHDFGLAPRPNNPEQYQRPRAVWELVFEIEDPYKNK